jgi:hypothetical protein
MSALLPDPSLTRVYRRQPGGVIYETYLVA